MLVPMKDILEKAKDGGYAVPAFMVYDQSTFTAACEEAQKLNAPLITLTGPYAFYDIYRFGRIMQDIARDFDIPVATCLDHGETFEDVLIGVRAGFTSLMADRSRLSLEDNIKEVREIVRIGHTLGLTVEAELGHVSGVADPNPESVFTVPSEAKYFVEETGIDCLAVSIGTAHGAYKGTPTLHFDILEAIEKETDIPLVLHGGSGTGDENLAKASLTHISKINIANDLLRGALNEINEAQMSGNAVYGLMDVYSEGYRKVIRKYINLLGCAGKA